MFDANRFHITYGGEVELLIPLQQLLFVGEQGHHLSPRDVYIEVLQRIVNKFFHRGKIITLLSSCARSRAVEANVQKRPPLLTVFLVCLPENRNYLFSSTFSSTAGFDFLNLRKSARPPRNTSTSGMASSTKAGRMKITSWIRKSTKFWKKRIKFSTASFAAPSGRHGPMEIGWVLSSAIKRTLMEERAADSS